MTKARCIYERERIAEHKLQFRATCLVVQHLMHYRTYKLHKRLIMRVLEEMQK